MEINSVQAVRDEYEVLKNQPIHDFRELLKKLGAYLLEEGSSNLNFDMILEIENILYSLNQKTSKVDARPKYISDTLLDCLAYANSLSTVVKQSGSYDPNFFKNVILLGQLLVRLSYSLQ